MAGRARGSFRRQSRRQKNQLWSVILTSGNVLPAANTTAFPILTNTDWERGSGAASERGTILSTRGWMDVSPDEVAGVFAVGPYFWYIALFDEDATSPAASLVSSYADEDVLTTGGGCFSNAGGLGGNGKGFDIVAKAMRRVRIGQELRLVITNLADKAILISNVVRSLVRIGGN